MLTFKSVMVCFNFNYPLCEKQFLPGISNTLAQDMQMEQLGDNIR